MEFRILGPLEVATPNGPVSLGGPKQRARFDEAEGHFEHALEVNARIGARPWLAYTQQDYARMLVARNGSGEAERAETLVRQARTGFDELGMPHLPSRARAS